MSIQEQTIKQKNVENKNLRIKYGTDTSRNKLRRVNER